MQERHAQRDEEHPQHLRIDGGFDLPVVHANLLQNIELRLVVIAFGNLLEVNYKHRYRKEQHSEEHAQEQQPAIHGVV